MENDDKLSKLVDELTDYSSSLLPEKVARFQLPGALIPDRTSLINTAIYYGNQNQTFEATTKLCGFLGFCARDAYRACANSSLINCDKCGVARASAFLFFTLLTSLTILISNSLVILVSIRRHSKGKLDKIDVCKTSLSLADFIVGMLIFTYVL